MGRRARHHRHQYAGRPHRIDRRSHLVAHPRHHAPHRRRRPTGAPWAMEGIRTRLHARIGSARQAARDHRIWPDRTGSRGACAGIRHARGLLRTRTEVRRERRVHAARSPAVDVRRRVFALSAHPRNEASDQPDDARADEAKRVSDQRRARSSGRRSCVSVGAGESTDCGSGSRCLRKGARDSQRAARLRERRAVAAPGKLGDRNAHDNDPTRCAEHHRGPVRSAADHADHVGQRLCPLPSVHSGSR